MARKKIRADEDYDYDEPVDVLPGGVGVVDGADSLSEDLKTLLLDLTGDVSKLKVLLGEASPELYAEISPRIRALIEAVSSLPFKPHRPSTARAPIGFRIEEKPKKRRRAK